MSDSYCTQTDLEDYILVAYLDKIDELNSGVVARTIEGVSAEIREACLAGGYEASMDGVESALLKRVCAVLSAWQCVGNITSLMDTEAASSNEWLPIQRQYDRAQKELTQIRSGKLDPWPSDAVTTEACVVSPQPVFGGQDFWRRY
ncbi:phage protein Gp36 family protein [uncultured Desulfobacter sp.]|uniref:phage protein Gp36 family protein n=1 Tax=uncultured Desulfobacter sp. TaxID=240139 RepID=UPI002AABEEC9|nr:phage protein Gp36 family protein [uncultured Desulfobacter sp.]